MIGGYHIFITHGHGYYVSMGEERLKQEARGRGADIAMYGHTHRPFYEKEKDLITLNPGSSVIQDNRGESRVICSCRLMTTEKWRLHRNI